MDRRTGETTRQLENAPFGALFVWCHDASVGYARLLARHLGRTDIEIVGARALDEDAAWLKGRAYPAVIIDHAHEKPVSPQARAAIDSAVRRGAAKPSLEHYVLQGDFAHAEFVIGRQPGLAMNKPVFIDIPLHPHLSGEWTHLKAWDDGPDGTTVYLVRPALEPIPGKWAPPKAASPTTWQAPKKAARDIPPQVREQTGSNRTNPPQ